MRKMASIQVIWKVEPIEGADRIELGHVMGWQCVVNKGVFKPMDKGVYFEIGSYLPIDPRFEFLRAGSYKNSRIMGEGFKIKTMKFKGQISQGLFLPLSQFPEIPEDAETGTDVTELLHVRKWEVEERATTNGTIAGPLPYDVPHSEETRIQNFVEFPEEFKEPLKELFETSDFVKFAKMTVDDSYNAKALPLAVNFVTTTYQSEVEKEAPSEEKQ